MGEALARAGMDPRVWACYGKVAEDDPDGPAVEVLPEGVFVEVVCQPSGVPLRCRYGAVYAAPQGTVFFPIRPEDEVVVFLTNGDPAEGPVVWPRFHNSIDLFPLLVNGRAVDGSFPFVRIESGDWEIEVAGTLRAQAQGDAAAVPPQPPGTAFPVARKTDPVQVVPTDPALNPAWSALLNALAAVVGITAGPLSAPDAAKLNAIGAAATAVLGVPIKGTVTGGSSKMSVGGKVA